MSPSDICDIYVWILLWLGAASITRNIVKPTTRSGSFMTGVGWPFLLIAAGFIVSVRRWRARRDFARASVVRCQPVVRRPRSLRRLGCRTGLHEGPVTFWYPHVNHCDACDRTIRD